MIKSRLLELGVSHVRDGSFPVGYPAIIGPTVAARYNELNAAGIKGNILVGHEQDISDSTPTTLAQRLNWIKTNVPDFTTSIEGTNEYVTNGDPARIQSLRDMQCDIWSKVKSDSILSSKLVVGPSSGNFYSDDIWYNEIGNLSNCLDRGNLHPYPGEDAPHRRLSRDLSTSMQWGATTFGTKPYWATESGYWNKSPDSTHVSEQAAGVYTPRLMMEYFRRGIERTQLYELIDLDTSTSEVIHNYGLLRTDGSPKPAYTATKNLLTILKDTTASSGSLGFGIVCQTNCKYGDPNANPAQDGPIRHVLLKQSSGAYYLAVWSESKVWDPATNTNTPKPAQGFNLNLHEAPAKVEIFDPATGTSPISTDTSGNKLINTTAPDALRLIKITPATQAPPATGMSLEAESMKVTPMFASIPNPSVIQADTTASAGQRLAMLSYGTASKSITTTGPANRITVRAFGDQCQEASGAIAPIINLKIDGTAVGSKPVTVGTWADYTFNYDVSAGTHNVEISYSNDYESASCNRNLYLDKVTFGNVVASTMSLEAESMSVSPVNSGQVQSDTSASASKRLFIPTYGTASKSVTTSSTATIVVLRAKSDLCQEASGVKFPNMTLKIDGAKVSTKSVGSSVWANYSFTFSVTAGSHTVAISYDNDYESGACNRNLYLDNVTFVP